MLYKSAYIKQRNGKWVILSEKGKVLGVYDTKSDAEKRLRQIEFFKHKKASDLPEIYTDYFNPGSTAITKNELVDPDHRELWLEGWGKKHKKDDGPVPEQEVKENVQLDISHPVRAFWVCSSSEQKDVANRIVQILHNAGYDVFFVGGSVRDELLGITPSDYDLVTSAPINEIDSILSDAGFHTKPIPKHHVVSVFDPETKISTDVAEYRKDISSTGRQTDELSIRAESIEEDLARRDFTVGAIAKNAITGELVDVFGGVNDLKNKILRTVGDPRQRFSEDLLRIIRGLRFAATFDFTIEENTKKAMQEFGPQIAEQVPPERIMMELTKVTDKHVLSKFIRLAKDVGLLKYLGLDDLEKLIGISHGKHHQEDPFDHTLMVLENLEKTEGVSRETLLAGLFHDIGKAVTQSVDPETGNVTFYDHHIVGADIARRVLQNLKFDALTIDRVTNLVKNHMRLHNPELSDKALRRLYHEFKGELEPLLQLVSADSRGRIGHNLSDNSEFIRERLKTVTQDQPKSPDALISGNRIMELTGIKEGPMIGKIKSEILDKQFEGVIRTPEDAEAYVLQNLERFKKSSCQETFSMTKKSLWLSENNLLVSARLPAEDYFEEEIEHKLEPNQDLEPEEEKEEKVKINIDYTGSPYNMGWAGVPPYPVERDKLSSEQLRELIDANIQTLLNQSEQLARERKRRFIETYSDKIRFLENILRTEQFKTLHADIRNVVDSFNNLVPSEHLITDTEREFDSRFKSVISAIATHEDFDKLGLDTRSSISEMLESMDRSDIEDFDLDLRRATKFSESISNQLPEIYKEAREFVSRELSITEKSTGVIGHFIKTITLYDHDKTFCYKIHSAPYLIKNQLDKLKQWVVNEELVKKTQEIFTISRNAVRRYINVLSIYEEPINTVNRLLSNFQKIVNKVRSLHSMSTSWLDEIDDYSSLRRPLTQFYTEREERFRRLEREDSSALQFLSELNTIHSKLEPYSDHAQKAAGSLRSLIRILDEVDTLLEKMHLLFNDIKPSDDKSIQTFFKFVCSIKSDLPRLSGILNENTFDLYLPSVIESLNILTRSSTITDFIKAYSDYTTDYKKDHLSRKKLSKIVNSSSGKNLYEEYFKKHYTPNTQFQFDSAVFKSEILDKLDSWDDVFNVMSYVIDFESGVEAEERATLVEYLKSKAFIDKVGFPINNFSEVAGTFYSIVSLMFPDLSNLQTYIIQLLNSPATFSRLSLLSKDDLTKFMVELKAFFRTYIKLSPDLSNFFDALKREVISHPQDSSGFFTDHIKRCLAEVLNVPLFRYVDFKDLTKMLASSIRGSKQYDEFIKAYTDVYETVSQSSRLPLLPPDKWGLKLIELMSSSIMTNAAEKMRLEQYTESSKAEYAQVLQKDWEIRIRQCFDTQDRNVLKNIRKHSPAIIDKLRTYVFNVLKNKMDSIPVLGGLLGVSNEMITHPTSELKVMIKNLGTDKVKSLLQAMEYHGHEFINKKLKENTLFKMVAIFNDSATGVMAILQSIFETLGH